MVERQPNQPLPTVGGDGAPLIAHKALVCSLPPLRRSLILATATLAGHWQDGFTIYSR